MMQDPVDEAKIGGDKIMRSPREKRLTEPSGIDNEISAPIASR